MGYWNAKNAIKDKSQYKIIIGERGNGKSYAIKNAVIDDFINNGNEFIYLRRMREDIKPSMVESYFSDLNIDKKTKGEYQSIVAWGGSIFLSKLVDGVLKRSKRIGYYMALSAWEHFKSNQFPQVTTILFEEFTASHKLGYNITYLANESDKLMQLVSTVFRDRVGCVYMIGNTVDRTCPYFFDWELDFIPRMVDGESTQVSIPTNNGKVVSIYVEKTKNEKNSHSMIFGKIRNVISGGEWETNEYITLFPKGDNEEIYRMYYMNKLKFCIKLYINNDTGFLFAYIYPYTRKNIPKEERVIKYENDIIDIDGYMTSYFLDNKAEIAIQDCLKKGNVVYASNACGTDFNSLFII